MKQTSRKKVLVSSVAMMMVATVSLGSATYAWFTSNPNATAKGLTLKATASKGLVIQTGSHAEVDDTFWGHTDYLNYDASANSNRGGTSAEAISLSATSFNLTGGVLGSAYTVDAASAGSYAAAEDAEVGESAVTDYYQEIIKCKLTGIPEDAADDEKTDTVVLKSISLTPKAGQTMSEAVRVAVQYTTSEGTELIGVYAPTAQSNKYLTNTGEYASVLSAENKSFEVYTAVTNKVIGTVETTGENYFTVTVYLDGEDDKCFTNNLKANDILSDVTLNLKLQSAN